MDESILSLFRELGLSVYESRVLYALFRLREADAKQIANQADVPRTKVYEILDEFVRRGYVTEVDTRPRRYSVPDPKKVIRMMIKNEKDRLERLEKKAETLGEILPVATDVRENKGNYILRLRRPEDLVSIVEDEVDENTVIGGTARSYYILSELKGRHMKSPFDFILTENTLYLPLSPLGEPRREVIVVVFKENAIIDIFRRWLNERGDL